MHAQTCSLTNVCMHVPARTPQYCLQRQLIFEKSNIEHIARCIQRNQPFYNPSCIFCLPNLIDFCRVFFFCFVLLSSLVRKSSKQDVKLEIYSLPGKQLHAEMRLHRKCNLAPSTGLSAREPARLALGWATCGTAG